MKPKYLRYMQYHSQVVTSFGARVCKSDSGLIPAQTASGSISALYHDSLPLKYRGELP